MSRLLPNVIKIPEPDCWTINNLDDFNNFLKPVPCKSVFNIFHVNIRSIRANYSSLESIISNSLNNLSVIILSEIWIYECETSFYGFEGYDSFFCCRSDNRSGGIVVFTKSYLKFSKLDVNFISAEVILLYSKSVNITLFSIYRNHDYSIDYFNSELKSALIMLKQTNIILMGDININILANENCILEYLSILSQYGFFSYLNQPTRSGLFSSTCIDHIFVKSNVFKIQSGIFRTDITDHYPTLCKINLDSHCPVVKSEPTTFVNYSKFYDYLSLFSFSYSDKISLNDQYQNLIFELNNIKNNFKYPKLPSKKFKKSWMTSDILSLIRRKEKLYYKFKKYPFDIVYKTAYKTVASEVKRIIKSTKTQFYKNKFEACNTSKEKWKFISCVVNNSTKSCILPDSLNNYLLASQFNDIFNNVNHNSSGIDFKNNQRYLINSVSSFVYHEVTEFDVFDTLNSFSNLDSFDYDGICLRYLKLCASNNISLITNFINSSFLTCEFPNSLKRATVTPIYKAGDKNDLINYRPISILPCFSKIIEKILSKRMFKFLNFTNFFSSNQFGFMEGRSTEMVLLEFSKFIYKNIDDSKITVAIFLDIKKAFDNVNHSILKSRFSRQYLKMVYFLFN